MQALTMNHNKIYVYSNDTQRNVSMRHAATISLLNLYPKVLGTFLASCRFPGSDGRRVSFAKIKESRRIFQRWHTNVESIPRIRGETITHWLHRYYTIGVNHEDSHSDRSLHIQATRVAKVLYYHLSNHHHLFFRATYNNHVVPTTWENTRE